LATRNSKNYNKTTRDAENIEGTPPLGSKIKGVKVFELTPVQLPSVHYNISLMCAWC